MILDSKTVTWCEKVKSKTWKELSYDQQILLKQISVYEGKLKQLSNNNINRFWVLISQFYNC